MGEIADMMLDGTMCEGCGVFLHDGADGDGIPGYCSEQCARDRGADWWLETNEIAAATPKHPARKFKCPDCGKLLKGEQGVRAHQRAKH